MKILALIGFMAALFFLQTPTAQAQNAAASEHKVHIGKNPEKLIVRKWKLDVESFKALMEEELGRQAKKLQEDIEAAKAEGDAERVSELEQELEISKSMGSGFLDQMLEAMKGFYFKFDANGEIEIGGGPDGKTQKGTWALKENGHVLEMTNNDNTESIKIIELSKKRLSLELEEGKGVMSFTPAE